MAKKTRSAKTSTKRSAPAKKAGGKKTGSKKAPSKRPTSRKTSSKKTAKTSAAKKKTSAKPGTPSKKPAAPAKKASGKSPAKAASKTVAKPASAKKSAKKTTKKVASASKPAEAAKPETPKTEPDAEGDDKKNARKGITIVNKKTTRRAPVKKSVSFPAAAGGGLLGPNAPKRKPLIPSGPSVTAQEGVEADTSGKPRKSPFKKPELQKYRELLLTKATELIGDVSGLEEGALRGQSGGLSHLPQHMAEFGSETYEQTLSLDLAAADRRLLKEIDDALGRIEEGTFGICEMTGKPIGKARLNELPWARYSIEAARDLERRPDPR